MTTLYERLGGETKLRPIIEAFVDEIRADIMIGFHFHGVDRDRLVQREFEFTARFLGADLPYTGRPLQKAHARHRIMGGQFDRRRRILEEILIRHHVDPEVRTAWLAHVEELRPLITAQGSGQCD